MAFRPLLHGLVFALRWTVAHALYFTGILHLLKRAVLRDRAVVLMYHRVLSDEACARTWSHPGIIVRTETFAWQMRFLREEFHPLTLSQFAAHLTDSRRFPSASCLVTFDDGWLDTYTDAWPILRKEAVPAVVFLPTQFIGSDAMFWQEHLKRLLCEACEAAANDESVREAARLVMRVHGFDALMDVPAEAVRTAIMETVQARKYGALDVAFGAIRALEELLPERSAARETPDAFMSWSMVREMAGAGVAFGGHGVTHRLLTGLSAEEVAEEARAGREAIARELGTPPVAFAYPNGDFNVAVSQRVAGAGYEIAFSTVDGPVSKNEQRFAVRRFNMHEGATSSRAMFLARLVGVL